MYRIGFVVVAALVVASCSNGAESGRTQEAKASEPAAAVASRKAVPGPPASQSAAVLSLTGAGVSGALIGTLWRAVSADFKSAGVYGDAAENCEIYTYRGGEFAAMVIDGKIARIEISAPGIRTAEGIGIGSSLSQLKEAYGKQLITEKNHYGGEDDHFVWQSKDRGLVFYMADGKVKFMAGGGDAIRFIEGCL